MYKHFKMSKIFLSTSSLSVFYWEKLGHFAYKKTDNLNYFLNPYLSPISDNGRVKNFKILFSRKLENGNWQNHLFLKSVN